MRKPGTYAALKRLAELHPKDFERLLAEERHERRSPRPRPSDEERFFSRIADATDPSTCWEWTGHLDRWGYGRLSVNGKTTGAHRAALLLLRDGIPEGLVVDHLCRNTRCVNPDHLDLVTPSVNSKRALGTDTDRCRRGHPFTPETTSVQPDGRRCLICRRARERRARTPVHA